MKLEELKARLRGSSQESPSMLVEEVDIDSLAGEEEDEENEELDDLLEALSLLVESADLLSTVLKKDRKEDFLDINLHTDLANLRDNIVEFTDQWDLDPE